MTMTTHISASTVNSNKQTSYLIILLIALIILMGALFAYSALKSQHDKEYVNLASEQRLLSQRMVKYASEAASADVEAFPKLKETHDKFAEYLDALKNGNERIPASPKEVQQQLNTLSTAWQQFSQNTATTLSAEGTIRMLSEFIRAISELMPQIQQASEEAVSNMVIAGSQQRQIQIASRQLMLAERIDNSLAKMLAGGQGASDAAMTFQQDFEEFGTVLEGMLNGDAERRINKVAGPVAQTNLNQVSLLFRAAKDLAKRITDRTPELFKAQVAAGNMIRDADNLLLASNNLVKAYIQMSKSGKRQIINYTGYTVSAAALLVLIWLAYSLLRDTRRRIEESDEINRNNQQAIQRLLDEINDLAEGDLTVTATVNDDITRAIAERINYVVGALRTLIHTINDTVVQVSSAATETQTTAIHLADATDHQAHQIATVVTAINEMAASIEDVSGNAANSSSVAKASVETAQKGVNAVNDSITGMENIREQIQETSKRIKRLGESSLEISEIVELINDLTDQTNILALNAAIQAAMAGDAGRGFAVVADEVQRLAEHSTDATKQIEALVKTIQSDTNEAIASMERSTHEVVGGTQLAQAAGRTLVEIETVSNELNDLSRNISIAAAQQSSAANNVSETMNVIQDLTTQTAAGTSETSASVSNLADLAHELRASVSGFKLPSNQQYTP